MYSKKKGQAAFEYLVTYGWAILAAIIAVGAISYFGFINPSNLMPNRCNFGKQLECSEYQISSDAVGPVVKIIFRNNFGKPIQILDISMAEDDLGITGNHPFTTPIYIASSNTNETVFYLNGSYKRASGEKQGLNLIINFSRADIPAPSHVVSGYIFTTVQKG